MVVPRATFALHACGLLLAGCQQLFGLEAPVVRDAAVHDVLDADVMPVPPDADPAGCQALGSECATVSVLRTCTELGEPPVDTACNWGCIADATAHCARLVPAGGALEPTDVAPYPSLLDITLGAATELSSGTGAITGVRGTTVGVENGIAFQVRNDIAVFTFKSLTIDAPLALVGNRAVVLAADGPIIVNAVIDARGPCTGDTAGPGGGAGGAPGQAGPGLGGGGGGGGAAGNTSAGGGGGHGDGGGLGGAGVSVMPGARGAAFGDATITVLRGGGGGGGGPPDSSIVGGGGGGAVQLASNTRVEIRAGAGINAGGCGGKPGGMQSGSGGGAGGTILIEAPTIRLAGTLAVNGGGGGGGGVGASAGQPGQLGVAAASGGTATNGRGGNGGARDKPAGSNGLDYTSAGGGGGGVGRIRLNTITGDLTVEAGGVTSPALGVSSPATSGMANVE